MADVQEESVGEPRPKPVPVAPVKPPAPKRNPQLPVVNIKRAEHARTVWAVNVESAITMADLTRPDFWSHVANKFNAFDRLEIRPDDSSYWAELLVVACDRVWAKVLVLRHYQLTEAQKEDAAAAIDTGFEVKHRGHLRWCVIRKSDSEPIKENFGSRREAQLYLEDYLLTVGRN